MVEAGEGAIALVGLPGSGKSRVGAALARRLGLSHVDTDQVIVQKSGKSIPEIFSQDGEDSFRELEAEVVAECLASGGVVSLGGGAIETAEVRRALEEATVIYIEAETKELLRRISRNNRRPLLQANPEGTLERLERTRIPLYQEAADVTVRTSAAPLAAVVDQAVGALEGLNVTVVDASPPYPVAIGWDCAQTALRLFPTDASQALLVVAPGLEHQARKLEEELLLAGMQVHVRFLPDGEAAKTLATADSLWEAAGLLKLDRRDVIVTLGGGATTDLGGFIAATWLRGIRVLHFPTSLLAMVDASIGGKTGINSSAGKNLIGAFHNPRMVVVDLSQLRTLPQEEFTAGLAEIVKAGYISDTRILELVRENPRVGERDWAIGPGKHVLQELVDRAIRVKAHVVAADFKESGLRETLNYGHTLAHAIEKQTDYGVRHGEAVSIGMVLAAQLAVDRGLIGPDVFDDHRSMLSSVCLPVHHDGDAEELIELMYSDKKSRRGQLRFVLLTDVGSAHTEPVSRQEVASAYSQAFRTKE